MNNSQKSKNKMRLTLSQTLTIIGIVISIWFLSEFSDMMQTSQTIRTQEKQLLATVTALNNQQYHLRMTQDYISSDAYVERALRTELKYGLPNETHIVIITPVAPISNTMSSNMADSLEPEKPYWMVWKALLFAPND